MEPSLAKPDVHVPHFPTYANARIFLRVIEGYTRRVVLDMRERVIEKRGTPQETRDWSEPALWIPVILSGKEQELATRLWEKSQGKLNPRHTVGLWLMCSSYGLCQPDHRDILQITVLGHDFLKYEAGEAVRRIDFSEGLLALLGIVAEHGPGKRADLLPRFSDFLRANSRVQSPSAISSRWYERSVNLLERNFIRRDVVTYAIENKGLAYLEQVKGLLQPENVVAPALQSMIDISKLIEKQTVEVKESLLKTLRQIDPYQLEQVVKTLLVSMGYANVEVTKRSNDGGVDVLGEITVGISHVREVVQVKKHQSNIQRKTLDELRGSLHRFKAFQGTIITTGKFSTGAMRAAFEEGAAPITLIDGERLVKLLIEHKIGASKETIEVLKFHPDYFSPANTEIDG